MAKSNFSKVEKALEEGLLRLTSEHLLEEADAKGGKQKERLPPPELRIAILQKIEKDLKKLHKLDHGIYKKVGLLKEDLKKFIANPSLVTTQEWKSLKEAKDRLDVAKKELTPEKPFILDEDIVEQERQKHINKRFNIKDKWLPLQ